MTDNGITEEERIREELRQQLLDLQPPILPPPGVGNGAADDEDEPDEAEIIELVRRMIADTDGPFDQANREWLLARVLTGVMCTNCGGFAKVYPRQLNSSMAWGLVVFYNVHGTDWGHVPSTRDPWTGDDLSKLGGEWARLRHWGLIEELQERREDGGRAGWWRITARGVEYVRNMLALPKYVILYQGGVLGHVGREITIRQTARFNYDEMMRSPVPPVD
jgi:hypothetical protein